MSQTSSNEERRSLLKRLGALLAGLIGSALGVPAAVYLASPLRRNQPQDSQREPVPVARLQEVPDIDHGGQPLRVRVIRRNVRDAWNRLENVRQGAIWLYRRSGEVVCLSTVCPHAGCSVDYDDQHQRFVCPCHGSTFSMDGSHREGPSPRGMDSLEVEVRDGKVLCRYLRFRLATAKKEAL